MTETTAASIEGVRTDLSVTQGRLGMSVDAERATVRCRVPDHEPLSRREPVLTLAVSGDGFEGSLRLDADDARVLAGVLAELEVEP